MAISAEELRQVLSYDAKTGVFIWRLKRGRIPSGSVAGTSRPDGYVTIRLNYRSYLAHRLAWLYMTGKWPTDQIDHIGGNPSDNSWGNLREATRAQNAANSRLRADNASGLKGVQARSDCARWDARIRVDGRTLYLGLFDTPEKAHAAYIARAREHFGDFARTA